MSRTDHVGAVVSGVPYEIRSVNGHMPTSLRDFVAEPLALVVHGGGDELLLNGSSGSHGEADIVFYEKSGDGKDVRTWTVSADGDQFLLTERAVF